MKGIDECLHHQHRDWWPLRRDPPDNPQRLRLSRSNKTASCRMVCQRGVTRLQNVGMEQRYHSLQDFLASAEADVDGVLDTGWGFSFPVKGREIEATVLFADISGFSTRTLEMAPAEILIYVQNFFGWITAEALHGRPGIVDKYIGDEVMVVFSSEFGSVDPFADAVQAAAAMSRNDVHAYRPHIGIASGPVIVGYAGTATQYNVSVFGAPVALAARCAGVRPTETPLGVLLDRGSRRALGRAHPRANSPGRAGRPPPSALSAS